MKYADERALVVQYGIEMEDAGLTCGTAGNVSVRVPDGAVISPSGMPYREITPEDTILMDLEGAILEGERRPSVEHKVHLFLMKARPEINAVIHSHPVVATAFAAARISIPCFLDEMGVYAGDEVRVAGYALSGTDDIATNVVAAMGDTANAALIASHGMVTIGRDLPSAMMVAKLVERTALTYICAKALGGAVELPEDSKNLFAQVFQYYRTK